MRLTEQCANNIHPSVLEAVAWYDNPHDIVHLPIDDEPLAHFNVRLSDEVAIGAYTQAEFNEVRDKLFGFVYEGEGEWEAMREEDCMWTTYRGKGTQKLVQLFVAFAKGEAIRYMDLMGWR